MPPDRNHHDKHSLAPSRCPTSLVDAASKRTWVAFLALETPFVCPSPTAVRARFPLYSNPPPPLSSILSPVAAFFAFMIRGTSTITSMPTTNATRMIVILMFLHLICFLRSLLFFWKTFACSFSWLLLSARVSACSVFWSMAAMLSCIWTLTPSTLELRAEALSTLEASSYFLQYSLRRDLDFLERAPVVADLAWRENWSE
mmetsp:Transcript_44339/g.94387  ORF Transcript_44339/g.94387 Transcript_44339/m.94387 type:complete len:201 (-) Transcript_44339:194-796(-)